MSKIVINVRENAYSGYTMFDEMYGKFRKDTMHPNSALEVKVSYFPETLIPTWQAETKRQEVEDHSMNIYVHTAP
jgi:hypothetical protein